MIFVLRCHDYVLTELVSYRVHKPIIKAYFYVVFLSLLDCKKLCITLYKPLCVVLFLTLSLFMGDNYIFNSVKPEIPEFVIAVYRRIRLQEIIPTMIMTKEIIYEYERYY